MKRVFLSLFVIILCLMMVLSACSDDSKPSESDNVNQQEQEEDNTKEGTNTNEDTVNESVVSEENNAINIVISPPEGWEAVEGSVLPVHYSKNTASFMVKQEGFRGATIDEVVQEAKSAFDSAFDNVTYINEENIKVDGKEAKKIVFTCEVSKMQMKFEFVYLFVGSNVYAITFGDLADTFDSLTSDYEKILEAISFQ